MNDRPTLGGYVFFLLICFTALYIIEKCSNKTSTPNWDEDNGQIPQSNESGILLPARNPKMECIF
jgi:hypothetical protein